MKTIQLAAIHSGSAPFPKEADPCNDKFDSKAPKAFVEKNIEKTFAYLRQAGEKKVDLVCTHELFKREDFYLRYLDYPELLNSLIEEIPGPTTRRIAGIAKQYDMNITANLYEKDGDAIYNTSVLIDRTGKLLGKYRKVHIPPLEKWRVSAGKEFPVFASDIGNIGFVTCYDIIFPEHCKAVALNAADILIHQTQGWGIGSTYSIGEALVRVRAAEHCVYMIVAKNKHNGDMGKSCIIDNRGNILAEADEEEKLVSVEITPDYDLNQESHFNSLYSGVSSVRLRQALERVPSVYSILSDPTTPLLERCDGVELSSTPEKIRNVHDRLNEFEEAVRNNRTTPIIYHW